MTIQDFRIWLRRQLYGRANEIQQSFTGRVPTSKELDTIVSLLELARDAENLSGHVFLFFQKLLTIKDLERSFDEVSAEYFHTIESEMPCDATDLVRRLITSSLRHRSFAPASSRR